MGEKIFYPLFSGVEFKIDTDKVIIGNIELINDAINLEYALDLDANGKLCVFVDDEIATIKGISVDRAAVGKIL